MKQLFLKKSLMNKIFLLAATLIACMTISVKIACMMQGEKDPLVMKDAVKVTAIKGGTQQMGVMQVFPLKQILASLLITVDEKEGSQDRLNAAHLSLDTLIPIYNVNSKDEVVLPAGVYNLTWGFGDKVTLMSPLSNVILCIGHAALFVIISAAVTYGYLNRKYSMTPQKLTESIHEETGVCQESGPE
jgi:hypothetical protein